MVSIDKKTGIIDAGDGWSIKMANRSLAVFNGVKSYSLSSEIVDNGLKVVVFNDLAKKGVNVEQANEVISIIIKYLSDLGLIVKIE
jgi:hypothetical protein